MITALEKAQPSEHVVEEIALVEMEIIETQNNINRLQSRHHWLTILHENFMRRFSDEC